MLLAGMMQLPNNPGLLSDYAEDLRRRNEVHSAAQVLRKAAAINPDDWSTIVSLAETEYGLGHASEAARAANVIRGRLANGEKPPGSLRDRIDAILKYSSAVQ